MCKITNLVSSITRDNILAYEEWAKTLEQVEIPVLHHIHGGMYCRQITIPKGTVITGQLYKFDHLDVMISGDITVSTDTGERKRLTGFNVFKGMSGKKRAGYAHEDTTWITVHVADGEDGELIQSALTADSFEELYIHQQNESYKKVIKELGYTEEQVQAVVQDKSDMVELQGFSHIHVMDSNLHGKGIFSSVGLQAGSMICPARLKGSRTIAGVYTNHSSQPNAKIRLTDCGDVLLVATSIIHPYQEITLNYKDVITQRASEEDLCQE